MDNTLDETKTLDYFDLDELKVIYDALTNYNNLSKLLQGANLYDANMATARSHEVLRIRDNKIDPLIKHVLMKFLE